MADVFYGLDRKYSENDVINERGTKYATEYILEKRRTNLACIIRDNG